MNGLNEPTRRTVLKTLGAGTLGSIALAGPVSAEGLGRYRDVRRAVADGYTGSPCVPGMGIHYINFELIDDKVKVSQPEALVYANDGGDLRFLGAEYLATDEFSLFGHHAHQITEGPLEGIYALHFWFFEENDLGKHAEFHSNVDSECNFVSD